MHMNNVQLLPVCCIQQGHVSLEFWDHSIFQTVVETTYIMCLIQYSLRYCSNSWHFVSFIEGSLDTCSIRSWTIISGAGVITVSKHASSTIKIAKFTHNIPPFCKHFVQHWSYNTPKKLRANSSIVRSFLCYPSYVIQARCLATVFEQGLKTNFPIFMTQKTHLS